MMDERYPGMKFVTFEELGTLLPGVKRLCSACPYYGTPTCDGLSKNLRPCDIEAIKNGLEDSDNLVFFDPLTAITFKLKS